MALTETRPKTQFTNIKKPSRTNGSKPFGAYKKKPTAENLELLRTAKKEWKDELKSSVKKREEANSQWWRDLAEVSKTFWTFLTNIERPRVKKRTELDRVLNEKGELTTLVEQTFEVQKNGGDVYHVQIGLEN